MVAEPLMLASAPVEVLASRAEASRVEAAGQRACRPEAAATAWRVPAAAAPLAAEALQSPAGPAGGGRLAESGGGPALPFVLLGVVLLLTAPLKALLPETVPEQTRGAAGGLLSAAARRYCPVGFCGALCGGRYGRPPRRAVDARENKDGAPEQKLGRKTRR